MKFKKYQHVQRLGVCDTDGILDGLVYIFPKIDGNNSTCFLDDNGELACGSRKIQLGFGKDDENGFHKEMIQCENIKKYLEKHPTHRIYGEWLVPQSLRTYEDNAWRKLYVFDICFDSDKIDAGTGESFTEYLPYEEYSTLLDEFGIEYIKPLSVCYNPTMENIKDCVENNHFLIKEGKGSGEGVVLKRYDFKNRFGRVIWAKVLHDEFKNRTDKKHKNKDTDLTFSEIPIVEKYVTSNLIDKELAKIMQRKENEPDIKVFPMLLETVYKELLEEEAYHFVKEMHYPVVNFKNLKILVTEKIKKAHPELIGRTENGEKINEKN